MELKRIKSFTVANAKKMIDNSLDNIVVRIRKLVRKSTSNTNLSTIQSNQSCEHYLKDRQQRKSILFKDENSEKIQQKKPYRRATKSNFTLKIPTSQSIISNSSNQNSLILDTKDLKSTLSTLTETKSLLKGNSYTMSANPNFREKTPSD